MIVLFRITVIALLAATLFVQLQILQRMPKPIPSVAEMRQAQTSEERRQIGERTPMIQVMGHVSVEGAVTVDGAVSIDNAPLEVEIVR